MRIEGMNRVIHPVIHQMLTSQIARLSFTGQLTDAQATAAFQIGDTYRRWNRYEQSKKVPKRPNYEQGSGGSADPAEECNGETERSVIKPTCPIYNHSFSEFIELHRTLSAPWHTE
jgi:hypothetical protein